MIKCECLTKDGYMTEYAYTPQEYYKKVENSGSLLNMDTTGEFITMPITFDIETSTIRDNYKSLQQDRDVYTAFMYHWQICIQNDVIFGRTWPQLEEFFEHMIRYYRLNKKRKLVIYIHNLSFEFSFMYRFFDMQKIFATEPHKILRAQIEDCFELRCSYRLSNMSLAKFIENSPSGYHLKAKDDLDYRQLRTPATILTEIENGYCYNDVRGLMERISDLLKEDTLKTIPMTSTGYVRRDCRNAMRKNPENHKQFLKTALTEKQYTILKDCFRGGNTASNRYVTSMIIENVNSWDISSSYPFVMLAEKFPYGKFMKAGIESMQQLDHYNKKYCTFGYYAFKNIRIKDNVPIPYLPVSKCKSINKNVYAYNGRVLHAENVVIGLTNVDFEIINNQYDYDELYVTEFHFSRAHYLPAELHNQILHYFQVKSELRGIPEKEYEYVKAKNRLNGIYGMTVTDIMHSIIEFSDGEYTETQGKPIEEYYKNRNNFLSYQWGVWVTAYARRNLQAAIDNIVAAGGMYDIIYTDTDSLKYTGDYDYIFADINAEILRRCTDNGIIHSCSIQGKNYYLGLWDKERGYDRFITLGAKKYAYETNGNIGVTVSGLNKKDGAQELSEKGGLNFFRVGETFHRSGRTVAYYNNDDIHYININGEKILTGSNIAIVDTTYTLGITDTMKSILINLGVYENE